VADIVNAVGQACSGKYWSTEPTAVFVVWDDWGGWYDHIAPWEVRLQNGQPPYTACNPSTQWGCGYTDGFRVPFLVVSEYTPAQYVSGACGAGESKGCPYPGPNDIYVHDFGSILAYIESNFGMPAIDPPTSGNPGYADSNAPDGQQPPYVPLSDFFPLWQQGTPRGFTQITSFVKGPYCFQYPSYEDCLPNWAPTQPDVY